MKSLKQMEKFEKGTFYKKKICGLSPGFQFECFPGGFNGCWQDQ